MSNPLFTDKVYENLPDKLKKLTDFYDGVEKEMVLLSSIAAFSCTFPNIYGIYGGDKVYPHLYVLIVASAASGKKVVKYARYLIQPIHDEIVKQNREAIKNWRKLTDEEKKKEPCPQVEVKILPANVSTSMMYKYLDSSGFGVIIIETEADTLSNVMKSEWGDFSDVLRKAFHNETLSLSRKKDLEYIEIKNPQLALLLSGTPDQVKTLLKSTENGLYSRFIIYSTDYISPFANVFDEKAQNGINMFEVAGSALLTYYLKFYNLKTPIQFKYTKEQEELFVKVFGKTQEKIINDFRKDFVPILRRHALIMFRITMILTVLRKIDTVGTENELLCSDTDFRNGLKIIILLIRKSLENPVMKNESFKNEQDKDLFNSMKETFTRQELLSKGVELKMSKRTIDNRINEWTSTGLITKPSQNTFKKNNTTK